ncbi:hypothetical protein CBM2588_A40055 [Cupriavidus taiwanensis]|nr:hypothetical protein CBM2588_A40055 [Cupriavidus taiwanensis]
MPRRKRGESHGERRYSEDALDAAPANMVALIILFGVAVGMERHHAQTLFLIKNE